MVGGKVIEVRSVRVGDSDREALRIWVISQRNDDELAVYAEVSNDQPAIGEEVWWQGGKIFFDGDKKSINKIGYSFDPRAKG
jgi:hypothetical protein